MRPEKALLDRIEAIKKQIDRNEAQILRAIEAYDLQQVCGIVPQNAELYRQIALIEWCMKS